MTKRKVDSKEGGRKRGALEKNEREEVYVKGGWKRKRGVWKNRKREGRFIGRLQ